MPKSKSWFAVAFAASALAACGGKTPAEVEAEKRKADEAWATQVASVERARQAEVEKLVSQEVAAQERRSQADEARAQDQEEQRERERLLDLVRTNLPSKQGARFENLRWNAVHSALCGDVAVESDGADVAPSRRFVASGERAVVDSDEAGAHASFGAFATQYDCSP